VFRSSRTRRGWALPAGALALVALAAPGCTPSSSLATGPQEVAGALQLVLAQAPAAAPQIELPAARVYLRDASSHAEAASGATQLDGRFHLEAPPGSYELCWELEGLAGCGPRLVVQDAPVWLGIIPVRVEGPLIHGTVLTGDQRPCWLHDEFFALHVETTIRVVDHTGTEVRSDVRANVQGEYALPGLAPGRYRVAATCEAAAAEAQVSLGNAAVEADLTLPNRAPALAALEARASNRGVTRVAPAALVDLDALARDADQDPIEYLWRVPDGSGVIAGGAVATQDWTLPGAPGLHSVYLLARDGKGGYAYKRFDLEVGDADLTFSGQAIDEFTKGPVAGAAVEVNGVAASTSPQGWFRLTVPPAGSGRYVLNIRHPDFALLSRVFDRSARGNTYELIRAEATLHDPDLTIDVVDTGGTGPCGSPGGERQRPPTTPAALRKQRGHEQDPEAYPCRHRGVHVIVPAGALETADGDPPRAPVRASRGTYNPERRAIPGDYRANDPALGPAELLSFGALYAEFRDADDNLLRLRAGESAEVRVPVSALQLPVAQPTIALWSYDEATGFWEHEGTATLTNTPEGWMYTGSVTHFSAINMDVAGNDPLQATCVRFEIDSSLSAWEDLVLRAYVSYGGTSVQVKETALDGAKYHAIYRIPFGAGFPPNTLRLELRGTFNDQEVVLLDDIINTDARPKMTGNDLWPPYPYNECGDAIVLTADPIALPYFGDIDATGRPAFLTGPNGQFLPENGEQVATDYYAAIDPGNDKDTLGKWWDENGFSAIDGSGGTRAAYLNDNDLGLGRDMNCLQNGGDLACFVTNYGLPDQNPDNADAAEVREAKERGATVAMEYRAADPVEKRVQFYVYGGGVAASGRIKFADLDGLGPKPVPHLCLVCHGGTFDADDKARHARFREFDLPSFKYSGNRSWDFGDATLTPPELAAFGALNQMVRDVSLTDLPNSPIRALITNWYPGNNFANAPVEPAVPPGWNTQQAGYHEVHGRSCRTCHVARDAGAANPFFTFQESSNFAATEYAVCGSPKVMPNAFVTYKNFWSDPSRVLLYQTLTGAAACQ
jgi:hypothetical protein